jgi:hypothetical protein
MGRAGLFDIEVKSTLTSINKAIYCGLTILLHSQPLVQVRLVVPRFAAGVRLPTEVAVVDRHGLEVAAGLEGGQQPRPQLQQPAAPVAVGASQAASMEDAIADLLPDFMNQHCHPQALRRLTIDYGKTFRLFPEKWGDIQQNIGTKPDLLCIVSVYYQKSARSSASLWILPQIGILSRTKILTIET